MANDGNKTLVSTWLENETVALIKAFARREDRTRSQVLRILIRAGLSQMAGAGAAPTGPQAEKRRAPA